MARKTYDWEAIEKEYRAGQLSIRQIAELYGPAESTIRKRADKSGWERDLSEKVRKQTEAELNRDAAQPEYQTDEREVVKAAGLRAAEVVRKHRSGIVRLDRINNRLAGQLERTLDDLEDKKVAVADSKDLQRMFNGFGHCCRAYAQLVILERQAYGLDPRGAENNEENKEKGPVKFVMNFGGRKK